MKKTALVTGANRGIGLEFAHQLKDKGYYLIATCRHPDKALALQGLADEIVQLDVSKDEDIVQLTKHLKGRPIDLLVNNAGIYGAEAVTVGNVERENFLQVLNVNCVSVIKLSDALLPNIAASDEKNILVISSRMGSIADNDRGRSYPYRSSKAALNCVMRAFALDVAAMGVHVILMHPGWVKTDMGGKDALMEAQTSVSGMLQEAEAHFPHSHAEALRRFDGGTIPW